MKKSELEIEAHLSKNQLLIEELDVRISSLDRHVSSLMDELKVSPEQLSSCLASPALFSDEEWKTLSEEKKRLDEKLLKELLNITNPKKTGDTYKSRNVQPHWLYVR